MASNQEILKAIHTAIQLLKSHQGIGARWSVTGSSSSGFIKDMAEAEASMAYARGVLTTLASLFIQDPPPHSQLLDLVNLKDFTAWADSHDEPSMTNTELQTLRRYLDSSLESVPPPVNGTRVLT